MKPHRLLFIITTSDFGGTESFLRHLVMRLDRQRFEPIVCSLCPLGHIGSSIAEAGIQTLSFDMAPAARPGELWRAVRRLARLYDEFEIDLAQPLLYRANMIAGLAARLSKRRPVIVSGQRSLNPKGARLAVLGVQLTRRLADQIIAVSPAVRDEIARTEHLDPDRIEIIRNGVDTDYYLRGDFGKARQAWNLSPRDLVIGAVGRLSTTKGFHHLIEALALLREREHHPILLIAGTGPESDALTRQARNLGLDSQVRQLGFHSDLRSFYSALDIFALTSLAEGSPNALLEAMSSGCASMATAVGGVIDILEDGRNGLLVPPASPSAFANALEQLLENADLRRRLGLAARHTVEERFSLRRMVEQHEQLYAGLLPSVESDPEKPY